LHQKVFFDVLNFIDRAYKKINHVQLNTIPTALVIAGFIFLFHIYLFPYNMTKSETNTKNSSISGVSLADHQRIFSLMVKTFQKKKLRVVSLQARVCNSLRDAIETLVINALPPSFQVPFSLLNYANFFNLYLSLFLSLSLPLSWYLYS
jgi:hypothetical protein